MKEKFITNSINFINKYEECDKLKLLKLKYGLEGIYNLFFKTVVVILIAILTSSLKETLYIILFYAGVRTFSYGIHAKSSLACWITTITFYNIIPLLTKTLNIPTFMGYTTLILGFLSMLFFAPADTPKKPIINKKNRIIFKILSLLIVALYSIIYIYSKNNILNNALIYALLIQIVCINPITYKLTKTKFNNYKYYHKKS